MRSHELTQYAIVADIGGTFARFSRVNLNDLQMDKIEIFSCVDFENLEMALTTYQKRHFLEEIKRVAIAIACPVIDDFICMTNNHWHFSIKDLKQKFGLVELKVLNDFTAIAMCLPVLAHHECIQVGNGQSDATKPRVVLGAGTGLGVAYLVPEPQGYVAYAGEGGHAGWGAASDQEWFIFNYLTKMYGHVSHERLLSGHGLENLYNAIGAFKGQEVMSLKASQIISLAIEQQNVIAQAAVAQFFISLGIYAGDLALTFGAFGGVYLAGGILPRLLPLIHQSDFRVCFENKGRFRDFNLQIPTYVITAEQPGILGAAVYLQRSSPGELDVVY